MVDAFTKRNHYNPCFWTALWNRDYFSDFIKGTETCDSAREQTVFVLNVKSNKFYEAKVNSIHYDKDLGIAEIPPESIKGFCKRWFPEKYIETAAYVKDHPDSLYIDFEDILKGLEVTDAYQTLMETARCGDIISMEKKGFLTCLFIIHAMRSHEMMTTMVETAGSLGLEKFEYFWLLKNAWGNPLLLARAVAPLAISKWTLYRDQKAQYPLCDSPIMIERDSLMVVLSPRLLLNIDLNSEANEDSWNVQNGISGKKRSEFRKRAIANSYKEIIFSDYDELQRWRTLPDFQKRVAILRDPATERKVLAEGANRIIWALTGFGRVPPEFENWIKDFLDQMG